MISQVVSASDIEHRDMVEDWHAAQAVRNRLPG